MLKDIFNSNKIPNANPDLPWILKSFKLNLKDFSKVIAKTIGLYRLHTATAILDRPPSSAATMEVQGPDTQ